MNLGSIQLQQLIVNSIEFEHVMLCTVRSTQFISHFLLRICAAGKAFGIVDGGV